MKVNRQFFDIGQKCRAAFIGEQTGLIAFGVQASIHMASSVNLIPTKGMTLPFISYGGSSLLASSLTMGLILALTRKRTTVDHFADGGRS